MDQEDMFHRVIFFLIAITVFLWSRVLGADDTLFRTVMGTRGEVSVVATERSAAGASSSGVTTTVLAGAPPSS